MCGIAGWIDWAEDLTQQRPVIEQMADTLNHRGPDMQGAWVSPRAALAHRRLIVIDPYGGEQPMVYEAGNYTYALTYNGEIYNFRELRRELESREHVFRTQSDTEVLLHTYIEWGEECVNHLNGIFAFGLWDSKKQQLLLARDHMGVKPLFYAQRGSAILFGSEIKALLAHPLVQPEINEEGMAEIFSMGPARTPGLGVFRDVHEVRSGHMLLFTPEHMRTIQYWSLQCRPHTDDLETTVEHIRELLVDTVRRQLIADVPVVALLSGGLDSSGLTALARREFLGEGKQLHTYSIDFVDSAQHFRSQAFSPSLDAPWVQEMSKHAGTKHHAVIVDTPELIENLLVTLHANDLPSMGEVETSLYLLFKVMKQNATVALSGEAADEIFGGYPWFHQEAAFDATTFPWFVAPALPWFAPIPVEGDRDRSAWLSRDVREKIQPEAYLARRYREAIAEVPHLEGEDAQSARRREIFYLSMTRFLSMLLTRKDRMSMAVGFEARVPYCDYRLVEYVWNVPWEMKMVDSIEKGILRRAFTGVLPNSIRNRPKCRYPSTQNPSYLQALRTWVLDVLNDPQAPIHPFISGPTVQAIAEGKIALPTGALAMVLFERVVQINTWLKDYRVTVC